MDTLNTMETLSMDENSRSKDTERPLVTLFLGGRLIDGFGGGVLAAGGGGGGCRHLNVVDDRLRDRGRGEQGGEEGREHHLIPFLL